MIWDLYYEPGQLGIASYDISKERVTELYTQVGIEINEENYPLYNSKQIDDKTKKQYYTLQLLKKGVGWVREINPSQPITILIFDWDSDWGNFEQLSELYQLI